MTAMTKLWHFTCDHGHNAIGRRGLLAPNQHPLMPEIGPVVWLTTDPAPTRDAVGLSSRYLSCDRMAYRYLARTGTAIPWTNVRDRISPIVLGDLEAFGRPDTWWISTSPVPARLA